MHKFALLATALVLASAPLAAESLARTAAPVEGDSELGGGPGVILGAIGLAAVVATVLLVTENDDDVDLPTSA
ncbi:hypothetical protein [Alteriqipengyuania lutimaris]|uniref:Ferrochelatase n=1 Tax=Alteriqipengyuania lutimaris TaxID=1538146 RepID=A0A395LNG5_9SPHN|nr:hypothetical protein [Alteriqipengyuania lutimaris]MBB3033425.1 hypothetical protein [Alteriqipengyuania lutimaris]RDS78606.1 hypothetical protein DL238_08010 [Alteriqipengyuania lutimaris]